MTSEFAEFPHAISHPCAESLGAESRLEPWTWVARQVRDYVQGPNWRHAALIDEICVAF